jgi:hypothetical protein
LKVDEQRQSQMGCLEVINALSHMLIRETVRTLQFNKELLFDQQIRDIFPNTLLLIGDGI